MKSLKKIIQLLIITLWITSCKTDKPSSILLFEHRTANDSQLYLMKDDGTQIELLTSAPLYFNFYGLSPDGTKMVTGIRPRYLSILEIPSGKTIKTIPEAGLGEWHELAERSHIVSWSPDSNQLVFVREISKEQGTQLVLYDLQNDTQQMLTNDDALYRDPVWSPDGTQIAAAKMQLCGLPLSQCPPEKSSWDWDIIIFNLANQTSQQLTHFDNIAGRFQNLWAKSLCNLKWSPDGKYILFENSCSQFGLNEGNEVFVVSSESKQVNQLTDFDHDDGRFIVRYTTKWLDSNNQLFVGYTVAAMMPPSSGLSSSYGYDIYQNYDFTNPHSVELKKDITFHPVWKTFDQQFILVNEYENTGCRQFARGNFIDSELVITPKTDWPLETTYSDIFFSANGEHLAYLTTGTTCGYGIDIPSNIVLINLTKEQIILPDTPELSGSINLIGWFEVPFE